MGEFFAPYLTSTAKNHSLYDVTEETPPAKRGDVCLIPNSKEFFISTMGELADSPQAIEALYPPV